VNERKKLIAMDVEAVAYLMALYYPWLVGSE
jgi:hypothetical protein